MIANLIIRKHPLLRQLLNSMSGSGGKDMSLWDDVVDACDLFMTRNQQEGNPWDLVQNPSNPRQAYQDAYYRRRANGELLIDTRARATFLVLGCGLLLLQSYGSYGAMTPTLGM